MAALPTPEQSAREMLEIFVGHFKCRVDDVLRVNNFIILWHDRGLATQDLQAGMDFAAAQGWIEILPSGISYKLTSMGYAEA